MIRKEQQFTKRPDTTRYHSSTAQWPQHHSDASFITFASNGNPMDIRFKKDLRLSLYGFSGVAIDRDWATTGINLMNKMWQQVRSHKLPNKGINVWVYEPGDKMFAGVELLTPPPPDLTLEHKEIFLPEYVSYTHIGPYDKIKETFPQVKAQLEQRAINHGLPYLEIYGHWTEDTSKLETELIWAVK